MFVETHGLSVHGNFLLEYHIHSENYKYIKRYFSFVFIKNLATILFILYFFLDILTFLEKYFIAIEILEI